MGQKGFIHLGNENIPFFIAYSRRKTIQISLSPEGTVSVKAPLGMDFSSVEQVVVKRAGWIWGRMEAIRRAGAARRLLRYEDGECHPFLGKNRLLRIIPGRKSSVTLSGAEFLMTVTEAPPSPEVVKSLLDRWYSAQAALIFPESLERCWPSFAFLGRERPPVRARFMKSRWGSWSSRGRITLNTHLVKGLHECMDYVMTHELCHMAHPDHGKGFHGLLLEILPDWKDRKKELENLFLF